MSQQVIDHPWIQNGQYPRLLMGDFCSLPLTYQSSFAHLKAELGLPPRIAGAQFCWPCVVLKNLKDKSEHLPFGIFYLRIAHNSYLLLIPTVQTHHGSLNWDSSFSDSHIHRQIKQLQRRFHCIKSSKAT